MAKSTENPKWAVFCYKIVGLQLQQMKSVFAGGPAYLNIKSNGVLCKAAWYENSCNVMKEWA